MQIWWGVYLPLWWKSSLRQDSEGRESVLGAHRQRAGAVPGHMESCRLWRASALSAGVRSAGCMPGSPPQVDGDVWPLELCDVWLVGVQKETPYKAWLLFRSAENPSKGSSLIIYDIMNELTGQKFSPKDPDDGMHRNCLCETKSLLSWLPVIKGLMIDRTGFNLAYLPYGWLFWRSPNMCGTLLCFLS